MIGERRSAVYTESEEPMYKHNCYIEALPPTRTLEEVASLMARYPVYNSCERALPPLQRLEAVHRIANCVFPMPDFLLLDQKISRMIRNGYLVRNPLEAGWRRQMLAGFPSLMEQADDKMLLPLMRSTAASIAIIGQSGVGKSTMVDSVLGLYPQIIVHTEYGGCAFDQQQLVWLKLECPFDGSLKGLCMGFFEAVDEIVGTRYSAQYGNRRRTVDDLLPIMARLAAELGLGVLVIDEIQRLNEAHSGGAQKMLNFFVQLTNTFGLPMVLVGTYKAFGLFTSDFAMARRISGQGDVIVSNLKEDDYWKRFLEKLWKFQWTKVETPIGPKLSKAMYEESQGIVDIAVKLYMLAQWSIIGEESELITPELIREIAKDNFHAVRPILQALRDKDLSTLSKIKDVVPHPEDLERTLNIAVKRVILSGSVDIIGNHEKQGNLADATESMESPVTQIAALLIAAGHPVKQAQEWAYQAVQRFSATSDIKEASSEAFRLATESLIQEKNITTASKSKIKAAKVVSLSGDLREVVKPALKKKEAAYDVLESGGVIRSATEFLDQVAT